MNECFEPYEYSYLIMFIRGLNHDIAVITTYSDWQHRPVTETCKDSDNYKQWWSLVPVDSHSSCNDARVLI